MPRVKTLEKELVAIRCAFCNGVGKDPFDLLSDHALCEVCGGSGQVTMREPIHPCAFCRGSGIFPGSRLTCTCCMGRGMVTVQEPVGVCAACRGAGSRAGQTLPCSVCAGKGVVTVAKTGPHSVAGDPASPRLRRAGKLLPDEAGLSLKRGRK